MNCSEGPTADNVVWGQNSSARSPAVPTSFSYTQPEWVPLLLNILHGLVLLLSVYVFVVLLWYERKTRFVGRTVGIAQMMSRTRRGSMPVDRKDSRKRAKWLRFFCIFGSLLCICSCVNDLVYYNTHLHSGAVCSFLRNLGVSILSALDATVYCFLWFRQYVVYKKIQLRSKGVRVFINILQWTVLFFIVALYVATNALLICCRRYIYIAAGDYCSQVPSPVNESFANMWTAGSISLHVILVSLFAFPLLKHSSMKSSKDVKRSPGTGSVFAATKLGVLSLVRRCLAISAVCVGTDVLVMTVTEYGLTGGYNSQLRHLLYNINVILNVTLATVSLKEWRIMLFPCVAARPRNATAAEGEVSNERRNTAFNTSSTCNNNNKNISWK